MNVDQVQSMIDQGQADAVAAVGNKQSIDHLLQYHLLKSKNDERLQGMNYGDFLEAKENKEYDLEAFNFSEAASTEPSYIRYKLTQQ